METSELKKDDKEKKRKPRCALCLNHEIESIKKGHKRVCKFHDCSCKKCVETREHREFMSDMQYIRRNGLAEAAKLGKRADVVAVFNERMKSKNNKVKSFELDNQPLSLNYEEILSFLRDEFGLIEEDDMIFMLLIALAQECNTNDANSVIQEILNVYKEI